MGDPTEVWMKNKFGRRGGADGSDKKTRAAPARRKSFAQRERRAGGDRRVVQRRQTSIPVTIERRLGAERRQGDRRLRGDQAVADTPDNVVEIRPFIDQDEEIPVYTSDTKYSPSPELRRIKDRVHRSVLEVMDIADTQNLSAEAARESVASVIVSVLENQRVAISSSEQAELTELLVNDVLGFGPLEPLLADDTISDILVNGPDKVWIERFGRIELTDVTFTSTEHLMNVITRIVSLANRRVDQASPMVDARLPDGSRINVIIPPLAVHFPTVSIRKFTEKRITFEDMVEKGSISREMGVMMKMMAKYGLNIMISGGTGTGKTTLLGAMSRYINPRERIVTIEDTAELQLPQPNVVALESRPANVEGQGLVTIGDLLVNALRMRPDRILVGEVRGGEASDMLQAMNTGHDGSIGTIHANTPRDALMRFETMVCMDARHKPGHVTRQQIASALDVVVQMSRMHDGVRRLVSITEILDLDGDAIATHDLYHFKATAETADGKILGQFTRTGVVPNFFEKIKYFKLSDEERRLMESFGMFSGPGKKDDDEDGAAARQGA